MPVRPDAFKLHTIALVAMSALAACSPQQSTPTAPVAAASDATTMSPAPDAVATQAPVQVAANPTYRNAPINISPSAGGSPPTYVNEAADPNAPVYTDDQIAAERLRYR